MLEEVNTSCRDLKNNRRKITSIIIFFIFIFTVGMVYSLYGHQVLQSIYKGDSSCFLNNVVKWQSQYSLEYYFQKGDCIIYSWILFSLFFVGLYWRVSFPKNIFVTCYLGVVFITATVRLISAIFEFGYSSLQMDFSAFYTAGEALNYNLSPYIDNRMYTVPIWDGISRFTYSNFLYPPLVATLFRSLAIIDYLPAKFFWMALSVTCIVSSLFYFGKALKLKYELDYMLILGTFLSLFYPFMTLLERGQIDAVTLVFILLAVIVMIKYEKRQILSGTFLAIATLFKLHCVYIFPFLILRHKWRVVWGYILGGCSIFILTLIFSGPDLVYDYIFNQIPRISKFGQYQAEVTSNKTEVVRDRLDHYPGKITRKDGRSYKTDVLGFVSNATLVKGFVGRQLSKLLIKAGVKPNISVLSLLIFGIFFLFMLLWQSFYKKIFSAFTEIQEFIYWHMVLIVILLSSPLTWAMNVVWLLSLPLIVYKAVLMNNNHCNGALSLCVMGIFLAAFPDYGLVCMASKYIIAEIGLFLGLLFLLHTVQGDSG